MTGMTREKVSSQNQPTDSQEYKLNTRYPDIVNALNTAKYLPVENCKLIKCFKDERRTDAEVRFYIIVFNRLDNCVQHGSLPFQVV